MEKMLWDHPGDIFIGYTTSNFFFFQFLVRTFLSVELAFFECHELLLVAYVFIFL